MTKMLYPGVALMAVGAVGIIIAIVFEVITAEPFYLILMKITAGCFGVGGALMGLSSIARRRKR